MDCEECMERLAPTNPRLGYWDRHRQRYLLPLCWGCPNEGAMTLTDRVSNLEEITGEKGSIPRQYYDQIQQLRGEVANLRGKIVEPAATPTKVSRKRGVLID